MTPHRSSSSAWRNECVTRWNAQHSQKLATQSWQSFLACRARKPQNIGSLWLLKSGWEARVEHTSLVWQKSIKEETVDTDKTSGCLFFHGNCVGERHAELLGRPRCSCGRYGARRGRHPVAHGGGVVALSERRLHAGAWR